MKVLVPIDFSDYTKEILNCIKTDFKNDEIILMHILEYKLDFVEDTAIIEEEIIGRLKEKVRREFIKIVEDLEKSGIKIRFIEPYIGDPALEIVKKAEEEKVGLILMGARGKGISRKVKLLLGSVSEQVLQLSNIPVLIIREYKRSLFEKVLYAFDFSERSTDALMYIQRFPIEELIAIHVLEDDKFDWNFIKKITTFNVKDVLIKSGRVGKVILNTAKDVNATMIVTSAGEKLGSTVTYVVRNSQIPVLVYK